MANPSPRPNPTVELPTPPVVTRTSRRTPIVIAAVLVLLGIAAAGYWVIHNRATRVVITDARVAATMVAVSARTQGWLVSIPVEEGEHIQSDQMVAVMDQREPKLALAEAEAKLDGLNAELAKIGSQRELTAATLKSHVTKARSDYAAAESINRAAGTNLERARAEWDRTTPLFEREVISRELWEEKRSAYEKAEQAVQVSAAGVVAAAAAIDEANANQKQLAVIDAEVAQRRQAIAEATAH